MSSADRAALPPVRLPDEDELARRALATPLLSRAVELARWSRRGVPVGPGGQLPSQEVEGAVARLGLDVSGDGPALARDAWHFAVDAGLVVIEEETGREPDLAAALAAIEAGTVTGRATPGERLRRLTEGEAAAVLDIWSDGVDALLADTALAGFDEPADDEETAGASAMADLGDAAARDERFDELEWDPEEESDLLDSALGTLYLFTASDREIAAGAMVPLPMVAAAVVMPEGEEEPSDEELDDMTAVVSRLDEQFRALAGTGLLDYAPAEDLTEDAAGVAAGEGERDDAPDLGRFGRMRLTPLGMYAVRRRMRDAGLDAPLVGDLRHRGAAELLAAIPYRPEPASREEAELWLAEREPLTAARQLLAAARGADPEAPGRRLGCQLVLALLDERGERALREVLDDQELGGLARVWLAERGADGVPPPTEDMVFWLTVDTLAAQLGAGGEHDHEEELRELVRDLAGQHSAFFDRVWRCDHPATAEVLQAIGRLHPDRHLAKQARKAAFRARSRSHSN